MFIFRWSQTIRGHRARRFGWLTCGLLVTSLALLIALNQATVRAESNELTATYTTNGIEYAVPGGPRNIVAEAPGRIWYTSTDAGGIGMVEVMTGTSPLRYRTDFYGLGANSEPYDLVYADGVVWFTLRGIRALGKIDVATREIETFTLLSVGAAPTGIDVDAAGQLWIAQSNGRISRFDPTTETFDEFQMPASLVGQPYVEDIAILNERSIWFTMPNANRLVIFNPVSGNFSGILTEEPRPMTIKIADGVPWVTANGSGRVGRFFIGTSNTLVWYEIPNPTGGPLGLLVFNEAGVLQVWTTENNTGGVTRIELFRNFSVANRERLSLATPSGNPWGIVRAPDDHIWIADSTRGVLYELTPPYIPRVYAAWVTNVQ